MSQARHLMGKVRVGRMGMTSSDLCPGCLALVAILEAGRGSKRLEASPLIQGGTGTAQRREQGINGRARARGVTDRAWQPMSERMGPLLSQGEHFESNGSHEPERLQRNSAAEKPTVTGPRGVRGPGVWVAADWPEANAQAGTQKHS